MISTSKGLHGGGGSQKGNKGGSEKSDKKVKGKIKKNVSSRFFLSETKDNSNIYKLVLRSNEDYDNFEVIFSQHGDSGRKQNEMSSLLKKVTNTNGEMIAFEEIKNSNDIIIGYKLRGLKVAFNIPSVYELKLQETTTSALQIIEVL